MKPGIYDNLSNNDYHGFKDAISKSGLDLMNKSPAHYKWSTENQRPETPAMQKGSLIHTLVLEPDTFDDLYAIPPKDAPKKPSIAQRRAAKPSAATLTAIDFWDAWEAKNGHKIMLSNDMLQDARRITEAVRANPEAMEILNQATAIEQSVIAREFETETLCKCRPDIRVPGALYDLKTTKNAAAGSFAYSVRSYRYHVQAAFYIDICQMAGLNVNQFGFIAVDTQDMPYQCTVFHQLSDEALELGRKEYMDNLRLYAKCKELNEWPGYPESYDVLDMSGFAYDLEDEDLPSSLVEQAV